MAFGNLTVDFKQLSRIPVRDRVELARSTQASQIFGNLTPTEIAALFPDYYKKFIPAATGSSLAGGLSGGTTSYSPSLTTGGAPSAPGIAPPIVPAGPKVPVFVDEILKKGDVETNIKTPKGKLGLYRPQYTLTDADLSDEVVRTVAGEAYMSSKEGVDAVINVMLNRVGSKEYGSNLAAVARQGYGTKRVQFEGYNKGKPTEKQAEYIRERIRILASGAEPDNTYGANEFRADWHVFGEGKGKPFYRDAERQGFVNIGGNIFAARGNYSGPYQGYSKEELQKRLEEDSKDIAETLPGTAPIDTAFPAPEGVIPLEQETIPTVVPQLQSFDPKILEQYPNLKDWYENVASDAEKEKLKKAITKLGPSGVQEIMTKYPNKTATEVSDKIFKESIKPFAEASSATNFYDTIRTQYPDKIDVNSEIWKQVDPELAKARKQIVDAETGLVGRDALLAADSAAKVLRTNNYIPRIASGGDNHSANHGSGRDANYSIDLAASVVNEQGKIVPVQLGKGVPEKIKNDMATAAYLVSINAEGGHRVGYPDASTHHSMHIQQDPVRKSAYWGYSETAKRMGIGTSKLATLKATDEGKRFLAERETINRLSPDQKSEYFDKITGFETQKLESQSADIVQTTTEQQLPGTETITPEPTKNDTNLIPFEQVSTANSAPNMKLGGMEKIKNSKDEPLSIVARNRDGNEEKILNFNPNERVIIKDGEAEVTSEYKKKADEISQRTDVDMQQAMNTQQMNNQYTMRQRTEAPKTYAKQSKEGSVEYSPSVNRHMRMSRFNDDHFDRASKNI